MAAPTYKEIQSYVHRVHGFVPETCWIAHVKEQLGLPLRRAPNRREAHVRQKPCPAERRDAIVAAFRHFGIV